MNNNRPLKLSENEVWVELSRRRWRLFEEWNPRSNEAERQFNNLSMSMWDLHQEPDNKFLQEIVRLRVEKLRLLFRQERV